MQLETFRTHRTPCAGKRSTWRAASAVLRGSRTRGRQHAARGALRPSPRVPVLSTGRRGAAAGACVRRCLSLRFQRRSGLLKRCLPPSAVFRPPPRASSVLPHAWCLEFSASSLSPPPRPPLPFLGSCAPLARQSVKSLDGLLRPLPSRNLR